MQCYFYLRKTQWWQRRKSDVLIDNFEIIFDYQQMTTPWVRQDVQRWFQVVWTPGQPLILNAVRVLIFLSGLPQTEFELVNTKFGLASMFYTVS